MFDVDPQDLLEELAWKRQLLESVKAQIKVLEEQPMLMELRESFNSLRSNLVVLETNAKNFFHDRYLVAGKAGLHDAVYSKAEDEFEYDKSTAIAWAIQNAPLLLMLDSTGFEKHAKAVSKTIPLDFVKISQVDRIVIRRDLDKYVAPRVEELVTEDTEEIPF